MNQINMLLKMDFFSSDLSLLKPTFILCSVTCNFAGNTFIKQSLNTSQYKTIHISILTQNRKFKVKTQVGLLESRKGHEGLLKYYLPRKLIEVQFKCVRL